MCVGTPARVLRVSGGFAFVDVGDGRERKASLAAGEPVRRGDYVMMYADLILNKMGRRDALETVKTMGELAVRAAEEDGRDPKAAALPFQRRLARLA